MAMTPEQVADWMRSHGVSESTIKDEAGYIASKYADPDENPVRALEQALPSYLQRSASGRDYRTTQGDPAVTVQTSSGTYTAPYRPPDPVPVYTPPPPPPPPQIVTAVMSTAPSAQFTAQLVNPTAAPGATSGLTNPSSTPANVTPYMPTSGSDFWATLMPSTNPPSQQELNPPPAAPSPTVSQQLSTFEMISIGVAVIGLLITLTRK